MGPDDVARLYRRFQPSAFRRACQLLGDREEARDVVHEIFETLLDGRRAVAQSDGDLGGWLYTVTTRLCLNRLRDGQNRRRLLDERGVPWLSTTTTNAGARLAPIREALAAMPEEMAIVMVLYYMDEMSHDEIAGVLGCSRRHVGHILERAGARLVEAAP